MAALLEIRNLEKAFPGVRALHRVSLEIQEGEVHAILGENGAGKTTLMNVLYGLVQPDAGDIICKGRRVRIGSPRDAMELGIGMVHQHFMLVPPLTVAENIALGHRGQRLLDLRRVRERLLALAERHQLEVDPDAPVWQLSVGQQQRVEILKALYYGADVLILDEPTAVLTPPEVEQLMQVMASLRRQGHTILFISHKLGEVMRCSDRVTVLRQGQVVATRHTSATNPEELARLMVGREIRPLVRERQVPGKPVLELEDVHALGARGQPALQGVSLTVREGEILGIAGVDGNGQSELAEVVAGLRPAQQGRVRIAGVDAGRLDVFQRLAAGLGHVPEDRQRTGLVMDFTVGENLILNSYFRSPFAKGWRLLSGAIQEFAQQVIRDFDIRPPLPRSLAKQLSGGNQQKVVLARVLTQRPRVLLAVHPTRGLDVGAMEYVHQRLLAERTRGAGILLISSELEEILSLSDRVVVMHRGRIVAEVTADSADVEKIGFWMGGGDEAAPAGA